jgi:hypothetical protein
MKRTIENLYGPIKSDLDLIWFMTNLYLEQDRNEYREEIESIIRITRNLVQNKVETKDVDPEVFSIVTALIASNADYFKRITTDDIDRSMVETFRGMLSTLRHTQNYR